MKKKRKSEKVAIKNLLEKLKIFVKKILFSPSPSFDLVRRSAIQFESFMLQYL